jgi:hypothetical protein
MIVFGLCFMMGKALARGTFPEIALQDLATIFILSSLFKPNKSARGTAELTGKANCT